MQTDIAVWCAIPQSAIWETLPKIISSLLVLTEHMIPVLVVVGLVVYTLSRVPFFASRRSVILSGLLLYIALPLSGLGAMIAFTVSSLFGRGGYELMGGGIFLFTYGIAALPLAGILYMITRTRFPAETYTRLSKIVLSLMVLIGIGAIIFLCWNLSIGFQGTHYETKPTQSIAICMQSGGQPAGEIPCNGTTASLLRSMGQACSPADA